MPTDSILYKIIMKDGSVYNGGSSLQNSKWSEIPSNSINIESLVYFLSENESLTLFGFEKYAHFVEATNNFYGPKGTQMGVQLHYIYLMGLKEGKVTSYRIALKGERGKNKYIKGDITKRVTDFGKEYKGKPIANHCWKGK